MIGYLASPDDPLVPFVAGVIALSAMTWTADDETRDGFVASWDKAKMILPLMLEVVAGLLLGRVGHEGLIPSACVKAMVGGNSPFANLFAAVFGAFMYFATLTEVAIVQGSIGSGMGKGPALALLLAGPALSLPSMLVIREIMGTKKTLVFVSLVIVMATLVGAVRDSRRLIQPGRFQHPRSRGSAPAGQRERATSTAQVTAQRRITINQYPTRNTCHRQRHDIPVSHRLNAYQPDAGARSASRPIES